MVIFKLNLILSSRECPRSRCDIVKNPIKQIGGALLRIYNNLDIFCQHCKVAKKLSDIEDHERMCNLPKCVNYEICQGNVKPVDITY